MAGTITTAFCDSAKGEIAQGIHNFTAVQTVGTNVTGTSGQFTLTIASGDASKFIVGGVVAGTNIAAGAVVASIDSATQVTVSKAHTGTVNVAATITYHTFKMLLLKSTSSISTNYGRGQLNVGTPGTGAGSFNNVGTDEVSGTGYTSGGFTLTNISPAVSAGNGAYWSFTTSPSWSSASFTAGGAIIYNGSVAQGNSNGIAPSTSGSAINKAISVHSFGGDQTVTSGTFTANLPTNAYGTAILQLG